MYIRQWARFELHAPPLKFTLDLEVLAGWLLMLVYLSLGLLCQTLEQVCHQQLCHHRALRKPMPKLAKRVTGVQDVKKCPRSQPRTQIGTSTHVQHHYRLVFWQRSLNFLGWRPRSTWNFWFVCLFVWEMSRGPRARRLVYNGRHDLLTVILLKVRTTGFCGVHVLQLIWKPLFYILG